MSAANDPKKARLDDLRADRALTGLTPAESGEFMALSRAQARDVNAVDDLELAAAALDLALFPPEDIALSPATRARLLAAAGSAAVKRLLKILIITILVLVVAAIGGVLYLNHWLRSPETHARVESELSRALKLPLKFKSLELSLLGGLRAEGITVPDGDANFFEVASFSAKHRILPLLRGSISLDEITLDSPKFTLRQRPDGSWRLPALPEDPKPAKPKAPRAAQAKDQQVKIDSLDDLVEFFIIAGKKGIAVNRYKGLGEMNPDQLWKTTMDPTTRTILKVEMEDAFEANQIFETLMGDEVEPRRRFIETHAHFVKNLDV